MNNGISSSSSDYETKPKFKKKIGRNINAKFDIFIKTRCYLIVEADHKPFKNRTQKPTFLLYPFQKLIYSKLDRLSLQQLECKTDRTDYPDKYNFLNWDIVVTLSTLTQIFFSTKQVI